MAAIDLAIGSLLFVVGYMVYTAIKQFID